ncbi:FG-GAP-like repeat-containing protein [Hymenobacter monticola]|uniref:FG-GAP-like repeat-containing protein n=1 Tax=Hymenobacter monticola TaxID=1705399 RepID=A0ABY4B945_9BACT|nr:FG-GAP-like repeat-containing protein [Hymenobacter monticola]UOE34802.1 FG-GAP-like repeat-containing protein [Hymenobacter monticola]
MNPFYAFTHRAFGAALLLAAAGPAWAQAPVITSVIPMANARAVPRTSAVTVNFSQPLTAASAGALKVFSSQRGGLRTRGATPAVVNSNALSFAPTAYPYMPGETVQYTVVPTTGPGGGAPGRVGQFTAAVGGTGNGNFQTGSTPSVGSEPTRILVADLDGDGDLDLANNLLNLSLIGIRLNNGSGTFSGNQYVPIPNPASNVVAGDVDGDGDLDLMATTAPSNGAPGTVSVRLNDGSGTFSTGQDMVISSPSDLRMGDVDGDGDLDIVVPNGRFGASPVNVCLNNGNGTFSSGPDAPVTAMSVVALGDMDNDGDLDLVANDGASAGKLSVRLNTGAGAFAGTYEVSGVHLESLTLGDVDGDGDLDVVGAGAGQVEVILNTGNGTFSGGSSVGMSGGSLTNAALGDVDGDGDLDLIGINANYMSSGSPAGKVCLRLNNGRGTFGSGADINVLFNPFSAAFGDVDGDGDLDILTTSASLNPGRASVLLNQPGLVTAARPTTPTPALSLFPNPTRGVVTITDATPNAPLTVLDALGRALLTATTDAAGTARLPLDGLPTGVYLVRSGEQVRRLAVE